MNGEGMCYLKKSIFLLCTTLSLVTFASDKKINLNGLPEFTAFNSNKNKLIIGHLFD